MFKYFFKKDLCEIECAINNVDVEFNSVSFDSGQIVIIETVGQLVSYDLENLKANMLCIGYVFDREEQV